MKNSSILIGVIFVIVICFVFYEFGKTERDYSQRQNIENVLKRIQSYDSPMQKIEDDGISRNPEPSSESERVLSQKIPSRHPILDYQRKMSRGTHPAVYGDPIHPKIDIGPSGFQKAYSRYHDGPDVGEPMNVPVPAGALKLSNERDGYPFYYQSKPLHPYDYFKPYGPNNPSLQREIVTADTPFYKRGIYSSGGGFSSPSFISSVNSYAPFPEVNTPWEKTGMFQTTNEGDDTILNAYRRPIAPLQDLFEYAVQDKDGFIIPLKNVNYLEDGDIIQTIPGKESLGSWKFNSYVNNKWVWA